MIQARHAKAATLAALTILGACEPMRTSDAGPDAAPVDVGADAGPQLLVVDRFCPGGPGCVTAGDMGLEAGAASLPIAPDPASFELLTTDVDGNRRFEPEDGDMFGDTNGNGVFDAAWLAGFGIARPATGVHARNPPGVRTLCLENGETRIAFVALDAVGLFLDEADLIRARALELDGAIDYVVVAATHDHQARDTIGIWGASITDTGYSEAYMTYLREQAAQSAAMACAALEPANVENASFFLRDVDVSEEPGLQTDVLRYVGDLRDPFILDDQVRLMRFVPDDGTAPDGSGTIATLINLAAHPEYEGSGNTLLSSDYVGWLRSGVEDGVVGPGGAAQPGVGGVAVFINGALGVQIGPNYIHAAEWDGTAVTDDVAEARVVGDQLAYHVLRALMAPRESLDSVELGFRSARLLVRVDNRRYHVAFTTGLFGRREILEYDPMRPLRASNTPHLRTEIAVIDVGRAQMITSPGELDPILFVGARGERAFTPPGREVVDATRTNPPDLSLAPTSGHLFEHARADAQAADDVWLLGLTNDFLGYFVPPFDWELGSTPYLTEAEGRHYEETNSLGPAGWPEIERLTQELLAWERP